MTAVDVAGLRALVTAETARATAAEAVLQAEVTAAAPTIGAIPAYVRALGSATSTTNSTTIAMTTTHSVDTGDTIVVKIMSAGGAAQAVSSVAGGSLTWRLQGGHSGGTGPTATVATAYCPAGLATSTVITATIGSASALKAIMADEWSRLQDVAGDAAPGKDATATTILTTGLSTGTQADNYQAFIALYALKEAQTDPQWSVDAGWTKRGVVGISTITILSADLVGQGSYNPAATVTGAADYSAILVPLKGNAVVPTISSANFLPGSDSSTLITRSGKVAWVAAKVKRPEDFGAKEDGQVCNTASITTGSNVATIPIGVANNDVGKLFIFEGAGAAGASLTGTISAYNSAITIQLSATASTTVASGNFWWASDDAAAIESSLSKITQPSGASVGRSGGVLLLEGLHYGLGSKIQGGLNTTRHSIQIRGWGGASSIEGGSYGCGLVAYTPGMTLIEDNGSTQTPDLYGLSVQGVRLVGVAGSIVGIDLIRTNRCGITDVVCRGRTTSKTMIGLRANAQTFDSSWHVLDRFRAIYCDKGLHVIEGYGTYWQSGEAEQCNYGYYGEPAVTSGSTHAGARHTQIGSVEFNNIGATAIYEGGGFLSVVAAHIETASSSAASTGIHIVPNAANPIDGDGIEICAGTKILGQNGASQYGVIIESGAGAGRCDFYTRSLLSANRVVNNTGSALSSWRGYVIDPTNGTLDVSTIT